MAPYRIRLLTEDGGLHAEHLLDFDSDDAAIDHAGSLTHPHEMEIWQGDRQVAKIPPWWPYGVGGPY